MGKLISLPGYMYENKGNPIVYIRNIGVLGNSSGYDFTRGLNVESELVFDKRFPDAFTNKEFAQKLKEMDVDTIDVVGVDGDHDLRLVLQLQQHPDLVVGRKAGQHTGGVVVVKQLAPEFQVQLAPKGIDAFANAGGLQMNVFLAVKTDPFHGRPPSRFGYTE